MKRFILSFIVLLLLSSNVFADRFWVGGTGTWDSSSTTHWSTLSGGAGGASVPAASDPVILDASSGGGVVTVNFSGTVSILSLTFGEFTGTLDFSVNNNNVTLANSSSAFIKGSGSGIRTFNMGNGTWTITGNNTFSWNFTSITNLTFNANSSTIVYTGTFTDAVNFIGGGLNYHNLTNGPNSLLGNVEITPSTNTFNTITLSPPAILLLPISNTQTATSLVSIGSSGSENFISATDGSNQLGQATLSIASGNQNLSWTAIRGVIFTGGASFKATNSFNLGLNSGIDFGGGNGCILGGWLLWRDMPEHINDNFPAWIEKAA